MIDLLTITKRELKKYEILTIIEFVNEYFTDDKFSLYYLIMVSTEYYKFNVQTEENLIIEKNIEKYVNCGNLWSDFENFHEILRTEDDKLIDPIYENVYKIDDNIGELNVIFSTKNRLKKIKQLLNQ